MDREVQLLKSILVGLMVLAPVLAVGDQGQEPPDSDYTAEGKRAPAYLDEELVPSTWPEISRTRFEKTPVVLDSYLPYPNPYSHPMVFVGVGRKADFRLETWDGAGKIIDSFIFTGVEPGFYKFTCSRMLPSTEMVTVVLWWGETERGRSTVQERVIAAVD